ncbi:MAG: flagellar basal body P-ring formation chaperone FlgA [Alkalilacustris sp.]
MAARIFAAASLVAALLPPVAAGLPLALAAHPAGAETLVSTRTIRATTVIGPGDVVIVPEHTPGALSHPDEAVGLEARVALYPGRPIRPGDLGPAAVVERNAIVPLVFQRGGLTIHAEGRALGRGAPGEMIRVMNLSSRTTVTGLIGPDGDVHVSGSARPTH